GRLPRHVAESARSRNDDPIIAPILGEYSVDWGDFESSQKLPMGDFCKFRSIICKYGIDRVVLAGAISRRPKVKDLRFPLKDSLKIPRMIYQLALGGDATVLKVVVSFLESYGVNIIGAHEVAPELLARVGPLGIYHPNKDDRQDISSSMRAAEILCKLDIGQSAVSIGGRVVSLEGVEGTDAMLERVVFFKESGKVFARKVGVLTKMCKPQQDIRVDLPSIGLLTVQNVIKAGLSGIAIEAGKSLILEKEATIQFANRSRIFIYGIDRESQI
ncbi:LpxI family protein, partial [Candidatus Liberibacter sp.]|uniref:LpxI family protein n=1 Tax=Candidatus Liberibacter sp. TaxID=34022 RepID=UPI0015F6546B